jgi:hypothetical protein
VSENSFARHCGGLYYENPPQSPFDKGGGVAFPPFGKGGQGGFPLMGVNTTVFITVRPESSPAKNLYSGLSPLE